MNTHQFSNNNPEQDTHSLNRPRHEVRLVARGGGIHLELVPPTEEEQDRSEARHEITQ